MDNCEKLGVSFISARGIYKLTLIIAQKTEKTIQIKLDQDEHLCLIFDRTLFVSLISFLLRFSHQLAGSMNHYSNMFYSN